MIWSAIILIACSTKPDLEPVRTGKEGKSMPVFSLLETDTIHYFNTTDIKIGQTSFLLYFSPTCPYCRMETRRIVNNIGKLKDVQFVLITNKNMEAIKLFSKEFEIEKYDNITIGIDTGHVFSNYFQPNVIPFSVIYNENKKLKKAFSGAISTKQIVEVTKM